MIAAMTVAMMGIRTTKRSKSDKVIESFNA